MPWSSPRPCPRCRVTLIGGRNHPEVRGYCPTCAPLVRRDQGAAYLRRHPEKTTAAGDPHKSSRWQRARRDFLRANPLCADPYGQHSRAGFPSPVLATVVDHVVPWDWGADFWSRENWQGLCVSCHNVKKGEERRWESGAHRSDSPELARLWQDWLAAHPNREGG